MTAYFVFNMDTDTDTIAVLVHVTTGKLKNYITESITHVLA